MIAIRVPEFERVDVPTNISPEEVLRQMESTFFSSGVIDDEALCIFARKYIGVDITFKVSEGDGFMYLIYPEGERVQFYEASGNAACPYRFTDEFAIRFRSEYLPLIRTRREVKDIRNNTVDQCASAGHWAEYDEANDKFAAVLSVGPNPKPGQMLGGAIRVEKVANGIVWYSNISTGGEKKYSEKSIVRWEQFVYNNRELQISRGTGILDESDAVSKWDGLPTIEYPKWAF
jgi:hypothetical protein